MSSSSSARYGGSGNSGSNKKGYFSLKSKELASQPPPHRKSQQSSSGSYGRMLVLGKGRGNAPSSSARGKMAVPKPVNLPSLRAETGQMTPLAPAGASSASSISSWSKGEEENEVEGASRPSAWGDTPAPQNQAGGPGEFPALGQDEDEYMAERNSRGGRGGSSSGRESNGGSGNHSNGGYGRDWSNYRNNNGSYSRSPTSNQDDRPGGWHSGPKGSSPARVEPGAIMIKKRDVAAQREEASGPGPLKNIQQQRKESPIARDGPKPEAEKMTRNDEHGVNPRDDVSKSQTVTGNGSDDDEDDDGAIFTPDQGKIIWSLEGDEMDFSRPLRFGDEEEDDDLGEAANDVGGASPPFTATSMDSRKPSGGDEENSVGRGLSGGAEMEATAKEEGDESDVEPFIPNQVGLDDSDENQDDQDEQAALEERRRQIMERREEELRKMRMLEQERENKRRELDRLRREEDMRRKEEEEYERRQSGDRGVRNEEYESSRRVISSNRNKDYGRGPPAKGEVRTLFNPKDPDRPIVVKPVEQTSSGGGSGSSTKASGERSKRGKNSSNQREKGQKHDSEKSSTYRSSRSLVESTASSGLSGAGDRKMKVVKANKKGGRKGDSVQSSTMTSPSEKATMPVDRVQAPVPKPAPPPEPAWEKPPAPKVVKNLSEIQKEEEERLKRDVSSDAEGGGKGKTRPLKTAEGTGEGGVGATATAAQRKAEKAERIEKRKKEKKAAKAAAKRLEKEQRRQEQKAAKKAAARNSQQPNTNVGGTKILDGQDEKHVSKDVAKRPAAEKPSTELSFPPARADTSALASLDILAKGESAGLISGLDQPESAGSAPLVPKQQQRRLFERGPEAEDEGVIDTFNIERTIDVVTEESSSSVAKGGSRSRNARFSESALSASAFTPAFQSTWAPQKSQLDSESLYPSSSDPVGGRSGVSSGNNAAGTVGGSSGGVLGGGREGSAGNRYTNLFSDPAPAPSASTHISPFSVPFSASYGVASSGGLLDGPNSAQWTGSASTTGSGGQQSSSRFFPTGDAEQGRKETGSVGGNSGEGSWPSSSVFTLPTHIRQPLMAPSSDPEEFGRFLERATFTPSSSKAAPESASGLSIGGKPLSTLAATPPAYISAPPSSGAEETPVIASSPSSSPNTYVSSGKSGGGKASKKGGKKYHNNKNHNNSGNRGNKSKGGGGGGKKSGNSNNVTPAAPSSAK